jgi:hypothetical protein
MDSQIIPRWRAAGGDGSTSDATPVHWTRTAAAFKGTVKRSTRADVRLARFPSRFTHYAYLGLTNLDGLGYACPGTSKHVSQLGFGTAHATEAAMLRKIKSLKKVAAWVRDTFAPPI